MSRRTIRSGALAALLTVAASPALALSLTITPNYDHPTAKVKVNGSGFGANATIDIYFDVTLDHALPDVRCTPRMTCRPLALLANVDELRLAALELATGFTDVDLTHARLRVVDDLEESRRMFHRPAGARLPVNCLRPRCALRRAKSSAAPTAAADKAVHANALDQLSPRSNVGGSSPFQARHPESSPRSTSCPATIAAPAPTSSQVVRRESFLRLTVIVLFMLLDQASGVPPISLPTFPLSQCGDVRDVMTSMPRVQSEHLL